MYNNKKKLIFLSFLLSLNIVRPEIVVFVPKEKQFPKLYFLQLTETIVVFREFLLAQVCQEKQLKKELRRLPVTLNSVQ